MTMKLIVPLQKYLPVLQLEKKEKCCKVYTCSSKHRSAAKDTHFAVPNICGCYFRTVVVTATDCGVLVFRQPQHPPPPSDIIHTPRLIFRHLSSKFYLTSIGYTTDRALLIFMHVSLPESPPSLRLPAPSTIFALFGY